MVFDSLCAVKNSCQANMLLMGSCVTGLDLKQCHGKGFMFILAPGYVLISATTMFSLPETNVGSRQIEGLSQSLTFELQM